MTRLTLALAIGLFTVCAAPTARACDCQQQQAKKQCDCPGQSCPGPCAANQDAQKQPKPKAEKARRSNPRS